MSKKYNSATAKVFAGVVGFVTAVSMVFVGFVPPAQAQTTADLQALIDSLTAQIASLQAQLTNQTGSTSSVCPYTWTRSLTNGSTGDDVLKLQMFLNSDASTQLGTSGAGSPGNETSYFGNITKAGVIKFQNKYTADVLAPVGLSAGTGYFGPSSRAKANALCVTPPVTPPGDDDDDDTGTTGSTLNVSAPTQPAASLAPQGAARVPFTRFTLTASADGSITVNGVTVERVGLGSDDAFAGVVLLDQNGMQLGRERSLNSNHQATIGSTFTVPAGTSRTYTVAGNMKTSGLSSYSGETPGFSVVSISSQATIVGSLPITGAYHTVNSTLSIGTLTVQKGANDPSVTRELEVGSEGIIFSALRLNAGSAEDVRFKSIRWDQSGSASAEDLENVMTVVEGTEYETVREGDIYSTVFPGSGILIEEGKSLQVHIEGDVVGGAARTVDFNVERTSDIYVVGQELNYGITPTAAGTIGTAEGQANNSGTQPFFNAFDHNINAGALTVTATNDVPAQNVANGANNANFASFKFRVDGEAITWDGITFDVSTSSGATTGNEAITNVVLVDENGSVLAGPADVTRSSDEFNTVVLNDTVTLPFGEHTLFVQGDLDDDWTADDVFKFAITPSTGIDDPEGDVSGQNVTPTPSSAVNGNNQTVKAADVSIRPSSALASQPVMNNSNDVELGRLVIDASDSGEDLRVRTLSLDLQVGAAAAANDTFSLRVVDSSGNDLMDGSDFVDPTTSVDGTDQDALSFRMSGTGFVVEKGTSETVKVLGSVARPSGDTIDTTSTFAIEPNATAGNFSITGVDTGNTITPTLSAAGEGVLTLQANGTLTISVSNSDPSERWYVSGDMGTIGIFEFDSDDEAFDLTNFGLSLNTASSSATDFASISFWNGATQVGSSKSSPGFTSGRETFTFGTGQFTIPADDEKNLTVKATFAPIGANQVGQSGALLQISTSTPSTDHKALGAESGASVALSGQAATTTGARYFRSLPTVATSGSSSGSLANGTNRELARFSVSADDNGRVLLERMSFEVATSGATAVDGIRIKQLDGADAGKYLNASAGEAPDGNNQVTVEVASGTYGTAYVTVPAGQTVTFAVEGDITGVTDNDSVSTTMLKDTAYPSLAGLMGTVANLTSEKFVWSPRSTTSSETTNDWTNSFRVPGLEFSDLDLRTLTN